MPVTLRRLLKLGVSGPDVSAVKMGLRAWNSKLMTNTTALYGPGAVRTVRAFQKARRLTVDGMVGQMTLNELEPYLSAQAKALYEQGSALTLFQPIVASSSHGHGEEHETAGLAGYPASDFFGPPGAVVVACEAGVIARFSGHDPSEGPSHGPHGPLGWSIYLTGRSGASYYMTHLGTRTCSVGQKVAAGQHVGTLADYDRYGTPSHCHCGVKPAGGVTIWRLMAAPLAPK